MIIKKSQSNELFESIVSEGFKITNFRKLEDDTYGNESYQIRYNESNYYFKISYGVKRLYRLALSPDNETLDAIHLVDTWSQLVELFKNWLHNLKLEASQTDKWDELKNIVSISLTQDTNLSTEKFDGIALKLLREKLDEVVKRIDLLPIKQEQKVTIINNINYSYTVASDSAISKGDWYLFFLGLLSNVVLMLVLTPEAIDSIRVIIISVFSSIYQIKQ